MVNKAPKQNYATNIEVESPVVQGAFHALRPEDLRPGVSFLVDVTAQDVFKLKRYIEKGSDKKNHNL